MLTTIRGQHAKKIIWVVAIAVIVVFVLSGARSFLQQRNMPIVAEIANRRIPIPDFKYYIDLARLDFILHTNSQDGKKAISSSEVIEKAKTYFRLLWKVKGRKITVSDDEIAKWVNRNFSPGGKFDREVYERYIEYISRIYNINLTPRSFEEYIRDFIAIDKLWAQLVQITVSDNQIRALYAIDTQEAKINYLFIPYEKFRVDVGINPGEIEEFYQDNRALFQREAKINIKYFLISKDDPLSDEELNLLSNLTTLDQLEEKTSFKLKETGFVGIDQPISEIGWQPVLNQTAFNLAINQISIPIKLGKGIIIVGKDDERPEFIPTLGEIKDEVTEKLILTRAEAETRKFGQEFLEEIKEAKISDLNKLPAKSNVEFRTTGYFKYTDYIEGLGLDEAVSAIVFSLEPGGIHSEILPLDKGVYIIQLSDKTPFNQKDFETKKQTYHDEIKLRKEFIERLKFLEGLNQEITLKFPL